MSNIFITNIVGAGTYAVPTTDAELAAATAGLDTHIDNIANLDFSRVLAWVETEDGVGAFRTLNCVIENFVYNGEECPDAAETVTLTAAISAELVADANITSIGDQQVHIFQTGAYFLWSRNAAGGYLYPTTAGDDVAVGAGPNGRWFDDGDLVLGAAAMSGAEKLRVVGVSYLQGNVGVQINPPSYPLEVSGNYRLTGAGVVGGTDAVAAATRLKVMVDNYAAGGTLYGLVVDLDASENVANLYGINNIYTIANTKTITNAYGVYLDAPGGTGSITSNFAFRIRNQKAGTPTIGTSYGIYQDGATDYNFFAAPTAIGGGLDTSSMLFVEDDRATTVATEGVRSILDYDAASTKASWKGVEVDVDIGHGSGVLTNCYDVYLDSPTGGGDITNIYALYINTQKTGPASGATLAYGIYQSSANDENYFAGKVGIADSTPSYELDVNGDINVQTGNVYRHNGAAGYSGTHSVYNDGTSGNITQIVFAGGIITGVTVQP
jgi:hypothetical protein